MEDIGQEARRSLDPHTVEGEVLHIVEPNTVLEEVLHIALGEELRSKTGEEVRHSRRRMRVVVEERCNHLAASIQSWILHSWKGSCHSRMKTG